MTAFHNFDLSAPGAALRVFETGPGDPAINGNHLYLVIDHFATHRSATWDLHLDVLRVTSVKILKYPGLEDPVGIVGLRGFRHELDGDGAAKERPFSFPVQFRVADESLGEILEIDEIGGGGTGD